VPQRAVGGYLAAADGGGRDHFSLSRRVAGAQFNFPARCGPLLLGGAHRFPGIGPVFKTTLILLIVTGGAVLADGYIQSAGAQCAGDTQIYIDPRLVPQRPHMTRQQFDRAMLGADVETQKFLRDTYYSQNQPIEVPFRGGKVLVSPSDPCIQQYIWTMMTSACFCGKHLKARPTGKTDSTR
jgi:hypothetical protein